MSDTTINQFLSQADDSTERLTFTPVPPTPAADLDNGYLCFQRDTATIYAWDSDSSSWVASAVGTSGTSLTLSSLTAGRILFAGTAGLIDDDAALLWDDTEKQIRIAPTFTDLSTFHAPVTFYPVYNPAANSSDAAYALDSYVTVPNTTDKDIGQLYSISSQTEYNGTGTLAINYATYSAVLNENTGEIIDATAVYGAIFNEGGGTITNAYIFRGADLVQFSGVTNPYFLWYDGGPGTDASGAGVFRVNHLGILAYYNPSFAKYTPGSANYERELIRWGDTGVFGTDNVAYIGVEAGGTGTNRMLTLLGAGIQLESAAGTSTFLQMAEISAPSAPAANGARLYCVDAGGKTRIVALFNSGAAQTIATEP